jgi:stress response protein YsnF
MSESETVVPVVQEALLLNKKEVATGRVQVRTVTDNVQEIVKAELALSNVAVTRVAVDREIDALPDVRVEGNVTIIPVVEERLVVEKRLFLKEEIHLTHERTTERVEIPFDLRKQRVEVTRDPALPPDKSEE